MFVHYLVAFSFRLVGDVLLATGFLSYSGPFNQMFRNLLLENWKKDMRKVKIPFSEVILLFSDTIYLFIPPKAHAELALCRSDSKSVDHAIWPLFGKLLNSYFVLCCLL